MTENEFQTRLEELVGKIDSLDPKDQDRLRKLAEETKSRHNRMKKSVAELQESLDYLRVSVKYLVFDLEATRRENQYLRKLIDTTDEQ